MVRSGTCQHSICICHLELLRNRKNHLKRKRLVLFFVFFVGIYVEDTLAEILKKKYISESHLFYFECVSTVRKDLAVPRVSLHLWGMDRVVWGGNSLEQKVRSGLKSRCSKEQTLW